MHLPDREHPIWKVIPASLAVIVLIAMMAGNYANGFDLTKDTGTIVATILAYLGGIGGKALLAPNSKPE
jgi:hypothetical protein